MKRQHTDKYAERVILQEDIKQIKYWVSRLSNAPTKLDRMPILVEMLKKAIASKDSHDIIRGVMQSRKGLADEIETAWARIRRGGNPNGLEHWHYLFPVMHEKRHKHAMGDTVHRHLGMRGYAPNLDELERNWKPQLESALRKFFHGVTS